MKDGIAGFRDLVDGYFICGENAEAFTAGGDIERIMDDAYVSMPYNCNTEGLCSVDADYKVGPNTAVCIGDFHCNVQECAPPGDGRFL